MAPIERCWHRPVAVARGADMKALWGAGAIACAMMVAGCGDDSIKATEVATLEASSAGVSILDNGTITVTPAGVAPGTSGAVKEIAIINTGSADLDIESITIESTPPNAFRLASDPTTLADLGA